MKTRGGGTAQRGRALGLVDTPRTGIPWDQGPRNERGFDPRAPMTVRALERNRDAFRPKTTRVEVTLYSELRATVVVEVPTEHAQNDDHLTQAALAALDASGGAEWVSDAGYIETKRVLAS